MCNCYFGLWGPRIPLPMSAWGFNRYGVDKPGSIETSYASQWDALTGLEYVHAETAQEEVIAELSCICVDRHSCYAYPSAPVASSLSNNVSYLSSTIATGAANAFTAQYPAVCSGTYRSVVFGSGISYLYYVEYKPAMLMMLIAEVMTSLNLIDKLPFALCDLPLYLDTPRDALVSYALHTSGNAVSYPHYVEGYYLLAQNLTP